MTAATKTAGAAKATAPKSPSKAAPGGARSKAVAPKPVAKKAPAKKAPAKKAAPAKATAAAVVKPTTVPLRVDGDVTSFRAYTEELAILHGYKVGTEAPFDNVVVFEKGSTRVRVTYSAKNYVRKAEGSITIEGKQADKFKTLNRKLIELAAKAK